MSNVPPMPWLRGSRRLPPDRHQSGWTRSYWFRIMTQARTLSESIGAGLRDEQLIADEAAALRDLLRTVV